MPEPEIGINDVLIKIKCTAICGIDLVSESSTLCDQQRENTVLFREGLEKHGFELLPGEHPIVPVVLHDAMVAGRFAEAMLAQGIFVVAFLHPVVPKGKARIRTQMSAALTLEDLEFLIAAFGRVRKELEL